MIRSSLLIAFTMIAASSQGATFAVSTRIYAGSSDDPASEHRVLFDRGTAYDLSLGEDRFVTIYNPQAGTVVLLDRQTKLQSVITLDDLLKITAQAKASVTDPEDRLRLGIDAKVATGDGYSIEFAGTRYEAKTLTPEDPTRATAYGRFADLALRMNILRPLGPPPFARMTLNSHIAARGEMPRESTLELERGEQVVRYRSTNEIGELTDQDNQSIEQLNALRSEYREVPWKEFPTPD